MMPYKRPAPDKGIPLYQPSAAAYQQLMQLQSQQPYVPVSCEYSSNQTHASADTLYPNTSTATLYANNLHHHLNLNSQTSFNACNMSSNNKNKNYIDNFENNASNFNNSTFSLMLMHKHNLQHNQIR